jgi:hypothetical protein
LCDFIGSTEFNRRNELVDHAGFISGSGLSHVDAFNRTQKLVNRAVLIGGDEMIGVAVLNRPREFVDGMSLMDLLI